MVAPESPTARKQRHEGRPAQDEPLNDTSTFGTVPPGNRPGHTPEHDQDRPPLDKFAERLGLRASAGGSGAALARGEMTRALRNLGDHGASAMRASRRAAAAALGRLADAVDPERRGEEEA